jgi:hypothetical protein
MTSATALAKAHILSRFSDGAINVFEAILALDKASAINERQRKDGGVVYTPRAIAKSMCVLAKPLLNERVFEPSCGRGVFVFALAEHHLEATQPREVHDALSRSLWACDLDAEAVEDLRALWRLYWISKGISRPVDPHLAGEDSLFGSFSQLDFDLTLGNPPYVRFQNLPEPYRATLQKSFSSCAKGNVDLYFAFIEKALAQSSRACLIVPNSWMASSSGKSLRAMLAPNILNLADYGSELPFAPVRAYVCVILAQRAPRAAHASFLTQLHGLDPQMPWLSIASADPRLSPTRWALSSKPLALKAKAHASTPTSMRTLADMASLHSGIATLADSSYAIVDATVQGAHVAFDDALTQKAISVPLSMAPKKIKLTKVKSESDILNCQSRIMYPYGKDGSLMSFSEIKKNHPGVAEFLTARKKRLSERDKGKQDDYPEWHAYGRKQGLKTLPQGALCALPSMSEGSLQAFEFDSATTGAFLFTSGFILAPKPGYTASDILSVLLDTASWTWILAHGKPWAGSEGKTYRSYGARLLLSMPIP